MISLARSWSMMVVGWQEAPVYHPTDDRLLGVDLQVRVVDIDNPAGPACKGCCPYLFMAMAAHLGSWEDDADGYMDACSSLWQEEQQVVGEGGVSGGRGDSSVGSDSGWPRDTPQNVTDHFPDDHAHEPLPWHAKLSPSSSYWSALECGVVMATLLPFIACLRWRVRDGVVRRRYRYVAPPSVEGDAGVTQVPAGLAAMQQQQQQQQPQGTSASRAHGASMPGSGSEVTSSARPSDTDVDRSNLGGGEVDHAAQYRALQERYDHARVQFKKLKAQAESRRVRIEELESQVAALQQQLVEAGSGGATSAAAAIACFMEEARQMQAAAEQDPEGVLIAHLQRAGSLFSGGGDGWEQHWQGGGGGGGGGACW
jgi:hypothetical protein